MKKFIKKTGKKLRGMTLVEMIIALAVFAMLGVILITASLSVEKQSRATQSLNEKVAVQGPIAEAQNSDGSNLIDTNYDITIQKTSSAGSITVHGKLYDTSGDLVAVTDAAGAPVTDASGNPQYTTLENDSVNADLNLKYVADITQPSTVPATT